MSCPLLDLGDIMVSKITLSFPHRGERQPTTTINTGKEAEEGDRDKVGVVGVEGNLLRH